jgi:hypothetical protein
MNRVAHLAAATQSPFASNIPPGGSENDPQSIRRFAYQYARNLDELAGRVTGLLSSYASGIAMPADEQRGEVRVAIWASALMAIEASSFGAESAEEVALAVFDALATRWQRAGLADPEQEADFQRRVARYLPRDAASNQIRASSHLADQLLESIGADGDTKAAVSKTLASLFAVRMLDDVFRLNSASAHHLARVS